MHHARKRPLSCYKAGFFAQLALRAGKRRLARIDLARRKLQHRPPHRVPVLVFDQIAPIWQAGHNHHCTRMARILAPGLLAIGQFDRIAPSAQKMAVQNLFTVQQLLGQIGWLRIQIRRQRWNRHGHQDMPFMWRTANSHRRSRLAGSTPNSSSNAPLMLNMACAS